MLAPSSFMSASVRLAAPSLRVFIILSVKSSRMVIVLKSLDKFFEFVLSVDLAASRSAIAAVISLCHNPQGESVFLGKGFPVDAVGQKDPVGPDFLNGKSFLIFS